jgi:hypothetical protein
VDVVPLSHIRTHESPSNCGRWDEKKAARFRGPLRGLCYQADQFARTMLAYVLAPAAEIFGLICSMNFCTNTERSAFGLRA